MRVFNHRSLALVLDGLGAFHQKSHGAGLGLALGPHDDGLALLELPAPAVLVVEALGVAAVAAGQAAAGAGEAGGHEGGAREDETDGAAVDAYRGEAGREAVHEAEVGEQRVGVDLEEEGLAVEHVQGGAVRQLHGLERALLGQDLVNVRVQERVRCQQALAQVALDRRLELRLGRRGESVCRGDWLASVAANTGVEEFMAFAYSFLNILTVYARYSRLRWETVSSIAQHGGRSCG